MFFPLSSHQVDSLKLAAQERMIKEQETAHRKQEAEHKKREAALQKHIERLNLEGAKMKADLADKHRDRQGAKTLGNAYQRLHDEKVAVEHQLNTAMETHKLTTQHIRELMQENQHLKASNEDARHHVVQTTKEIQVCYWSVQLARHVSCIMSCITLHGFVFSQKYKNCSLFEAAASCI